MRSRSRASSRPLEVSRASTGLAETASAPRMKASFRMPRASPDGKGAAVALCKELFPPQVAVGFLDVAPQLVALLGRHLARALRAALALAVGVAHILAHALALVVAHLAVLASIVPAALALGERRPGGQNEGE